jgi:hypothetical protein
MNLRAALEELKSTKTKHPYNVVQIPEREGLYVGTDSEHRVAIFIKSDNEPPIPSIKTDKLQVDFSSDYQLYLNGKQSVVSNFHSIRCLSNDPDDTRLFTDIIESIISDPNTDYKAQSLSSIFYALVGLFETTPQQDVRKERQGLWGELFFMRQYGGYEKWIPVWHSDPSRLFDFSMDSKRIEVKTSTRPERIHEFSHRQLFSIGSEKVVVVSLMLREEDTGLSLRTLINEAKAKLKGKSHYIRLERAIIKADMDEPTEEGPRYNEAEARNQLAWYEIENVPHFPTPEPQGVSGTHYRSDLTTAQKMPEEEIRKTIEEWGPEAITS